MFFPEFERLTSEHVVWAERLRDLDDLLAGAGDFFISARSVTLSLREDKSWIQARLEDLAATGALEKEVDIKCGHCGVLTAAADGESCLGCGLDFDDSAAEIERFRLAARFQEASREHVAANPKHYEALMPSSGTGAMYPLI